MKVIFIRHGEPNYDCLKDKNIISCTKNIAPLSKEGRKQANEIYEKYEDILKESDKIVSSPYTRALETAFIINQYLGKELIIDVDLHEWESDEDRYLFNSCAVQEMEKEFYKNKGKHNETCIWNWESLDDLGLRVKNALLKYSHYDSIVVVCHAMIIRQFYYDPIIPNCVPIVVNINSNTKFTGFYGG